MASPVVIVGGLAVAGTLAYVLYKRAKATPTDPCAKCSKSGDPYTYAACLAECSGVLGGIVEAVTGLYESEDGKKFGAEVARRQAVNDGLNGAADVANPTSDPHWSGIAGTFAGSINPLTGKTARYKNGCVPYFGSPGWSPCKPGTLDMLGAAISTATGVVNFNDGNMGADPAFGSIEEKNAKFPACAWGTGYAGNTRCIPAFEPLKESATMTGRKGDGATIGPFSNGSGDPYWYVRAQKISCPAGKAPISVVEQLFGVAPQGLPEVCVPKNVSPQKDQLVSSYVGSGCAKLNWTWDTGSSSWRPLKVGEVRNLIGSGCPSAGQSVGVGGSIAHTLGGL